MMKSPLEVVNKDYMGDYLGCPMDVDGRSSAKFNVLVDKVNNKISSWKFSNLSAVGKIVLINGVLIALDSHILSIYMCLALVLRKLTFTLTKIWWPKGSSTHSSPIYIIKELI